MEGGVHDTDDDDIAAVQDILGVDRRTAAYYYEICGGDTQRALGEYYESKGAAPPADWEPKEGASPEGSTKHKSSSTNSSSTTTRGKGEKVAAIPNLGCYEPLATLKDEFRYNIHLQDAIREMDKSYSGWRRMRGDGNCYWLICWVRPFRRALVAHAAGDSSQAKELQRLIDTASLPSPATTSSPSAATAAAAARKPRDCLSSHAAGYLKAHGTWGHKGARYPRARKRSVLLCTSLCCKQHA